MYPYPRGIRPGCLLSTWIFQLARSVVHAGPDFDFERRCIHHSPPKRESSATLLRYSAHYSKPSPLSEPTLSAGTSKGGCLGAPHLYRSDGYTMWIQCYVLHAELHMACSRVAKPPDSFVHAPDPGKQKKICTRNKAELSEPYFTTNVITSCVYLHYWFSTARLDMLSD